METYQILFIFRKAADSRELVERAPTNAGDEVIRNRKHHDFEPASEGLRVNLWRKVDAVTDQFTTRYTVGNVRDHQLKFSYMPVNVATANAICSVHAISFSEV